MDRSAYDDYLRKFNARDYDGVLDYYHDDFELSFAGYLFTTKAAVKSFYGFLHSYLDERIVIDRFISDRTTVALEARVQLKGLRDLTPEVLAAEGFERMGVMSAGQEIEIPQFIHYHLEDGKIRKALCAIFMPPVPG